MLGLNGRATDVDMFSYFLAEKLHMTVEEVEQMTHSEYVNWSAYYTVKHALENKKSRDA